MGNLLVAVFALTAIILGCSNAKPGSVNAAKPLRIPSREADETLIPIAVESSGPKKSKVFQRVGK